MTDKEKLELLIALRQAFRAARPDLNLPPAGRMPASLQGRREEMRQRLIRQKKASLEHTARQHPETLARVIRQLLERSKKRS